MFGIRASEQVGALLAERGIEMLTGDAPGSFDEGLLRIAPGRADQSRRRDQHAARRGTAAGGRPARWRSGFVPVDEHGRVSGMQRVFAAGDVTTFPIKQGGIAAQQADVAAEAIAAELGIDGQGAPL